MPTLTPAASRSHRTTTTLFAVFSVAALVYAGVGTHLVTQQQHVLRHSYPVPATVVGFDVERHSTSSRGGTSTAYRPVVRFQYKIAGAIRMGDQVGPLPESRSGHWAWRVLDRYQVGEQVTAWVRDDVPDAAYLEHSASWIPYTTMFFGLACTALVGWLWLRYERRVARANGPSS